MNNLLDILEERESNSQGKIKLWTLNVSGRFSRAHFTGIFCKAKTMAGALLCLERYAEAKGLPSILEDEEAMFAYDENESIEDFIEAFSDVDGNEFGFSSFPFSAFTN